MNSTCGSTPPIPNLDLPNHSTDLNKTLGMIGTPHEESIATILSTKTCQIKRNRRNPAKSPLTHKFGNHGPKNHEGFPQIPPTKSPRARSRKHPKKTTKNNREQHNKALRNHAGSSIHTKKVHTRSSLPPDHPTLSQDLTMKLSS
jgi:hypothetical protein